MQKLSRKNNLQLNYPDIAKEWHPTKNKIKPNQIQAKSGKVFWFICSRCKHEYSKQLYQRTFHGIGCTICNRGNSKVSKNQLRFYCELKKIFKNVDIEVRIKGSFYLDILIKDLNLGLEFDGSRYHKSEKKIITDLKKNNLIKKKGIFLIRVRQRPLKKMNTQDVLVSQQLTSFNDIKYFLLSIKTNVELSEEINEKINKYLDNGKLINNKDYRKYISNYPNPIYKFTLEFKYPEIAREWDYEANYPFKPYQIGAGMGHLKVHLICNNCKTKYRIGLGSRIKRKGKYCDSCNTLEKIHPDFLNKYWDYKKNKKDPQKVNKGTKDKFWFKCHGSNLTHSHLLETYTFINQKHKFCIPCLKNKYLYKRRTNTLFVECPELKKELHPEKNKNNIFSDIYKTDEKRLHWICENGHEYPMNVRTKHEHYIKKEIACPKCLIKFQNKERRKINSLKITHPKLCKDWHPTKNKDLKLEMVTKSSRDMVFWLCHICNKESKARIVNRAKTGRSRFCKSH